MKKILDSGMLIIVLFCIFLAYSGVYADVGEIQWEENGLPVCNKNGFQKDQDIISDGENGVIIVWQDSRNDSGEYECYVENYDIYAQRLDVNGNILWNVEDVAICSTEENQQNTQIISDGNNGAIIVWEDSRNGLSNVDIYAQRVDRDGNVLWTTNGMLICTADGNQDNPQLISDGNGGAIITWQDLRGTSYDIYAQRVDANGNVLWITDGVPICMADGGQRNPQLISDGNSGAIITWQDANIYAQRVDANGNVLWTADGVPICTADNGQFSSQLISDNHGGAIITWTDARNCYYGPEYYIYNADIYAQRVDMNGNIVWALDGVPICDIDEDQKYPQIVSNGNSGAIITWQDCRGGYSNIDIYAQQIDADGNILWEEGGVAVCIASFNQESPRLVSDRIDGAIITWKDLRNNDYYDIYAQRINTDGNILWTTNGEDICTEVDNQDSPQIVLDNSGGTIIIWEDDRYDSSTEADIYAQKVLVYDITANINYTIGKDGGTVSFQGGATFVPDEEGRYVVSYIWDFGDEYSSTEANPIHHYTKVGNYNVSLKITDNLGRDGIAQANIEVTPNLTSSTAVTASSYYNDNFSPDKANDGICGAWDEYEWASKGEMAPWIDFKWSTAQTINKVVFYDRCNPVDHISDAWMYLKKNGSVVKAIHVGMFPFGGSAKEVIFDPVTVDEIFLDITDGWGLNVGLSEMQAYYDPLLQTIDNLAESAAIVASSYYNDTYTPDMAKDGIYGAWDEYEWASNGEMTPWIGFHWYDGAHTINKIVLYDRCNPVDHIEDAWLVLQKNHAEVKRIHIGMFPFGGSAKEIIFTPVSVDDILLVITDGWGLNVGLSEIQAFYDPGLETTVNLANSAAVTASSYYNENFSPNKANDGIYGAWDEYEWASSGEMAPWINFKWSTAHTINKVVLYDRCNPVDHISDAWMYFKKNGSVVKSIHVGMFPFGGAAKEINFDPVSVDEIYLDITDGWGLNVGLSELQVFEE